MADENTYSSRLTLQRGGVCHDVQADQVNTDILQRLFGVCAYMNVLHYLKHDAL